MPKTTNRNIKPISIRLPDISREQLAALMLDWGETQSAAIVRCIALVYLERQQVKARAGEKPPKADKL